MSRTFVTMCQNVPGAQHVSQKESSVPGATVKVPLWSVTVMGMVMDTQ